MDNEAIKNELILRSSKISESILKKSNKKYSTPPIPIVIDGAMKKFIRLINDEIDNIITENGMTFEGNQKEELIFYLIPTVDELTYKHLVKVFSYSPP